MAKVLTSGIDISFYQSDDGVTPKRYFDPQVAKAKNVKFAFIKASERMGKDPSVEVFARTFHEAGIPHSFYHFARPSEYGANPAQQAQFFYNIIKNYNWNLPPVLDVERQGVGLSYIKLFMETLEGLCGVTPILYTSPGFWTSLAGHQYAHWVEKYPLWVAQYFSALKYPTYAIPEQVTNSTTLPTVPTPFPKWTFWQYSQTGDGEFYGGNYASWTDSTGLDLNVYNGSEEQMYAQFGIGEVTVPSDPPAEPPVEPPVDLPKQVKVMPDKLSFRHIAKLYDGDRPFIPRGTIVNVLDREQTDIYWYKVQTSGGDVGYISAEKGYTAEV